MEDIKPAELLNKSSQIKECKYKDGTLYITFKSGGKYSYYPVSFFEFTSLITAPSSGSYLNKEIIKNPKIKATKLS